MPETPEPPEDIAHEARLEAVLESITDGFYALDSDWRYVVFNRAAEAYFGVPRDAILGKVIWDIFPQGLGTPFERACRAAMGERVPSTFETESRLRPDRIVELRILPMRDGGVAVCLSDVTERREAEERQQLLVNELNHRVKNSLATVQAIAAQTLTAADAEVRERFTARLMALARANDLLVARTWEGAGLREIAEQAASPHAGAERFIIEGPDVKLNAKAATTMALALHELATNAAKYGSLSTPAGRVELRWAVDGAGSFELTWRESGGPPVSPPKRTGFGTRLIQKGLSGEMKARVSLDYQPGGLVCTLNAPLQA